MSTYDVSREVDTVTMSMDISTAEKLVVLLSAVSDTTYRYGADDFQQMAAELVHKGEVRNPSPLYMFRLFGDNGAPTINHCTGEEYEKLYERTHGTLRECEHCGGKTQKHYLNCPVWRFNK